MENRFFKRKLFVALIFLVASLFTACSSITIKPVQYGWPVENVVKIASDFNITFPRYSISMNVKNIFEKENLINNNSPVSHQVRFIRDNRGYYYLTGEMFKNVYVLVPEDSEMKVVNEIFINKKGMVSPAMNQRGNYIELLLNNGKKRLKINKDGIL